MDEQDPLADDLRRAGDGDRAAWERLVRALASRLNAIAYRILRDAHAAEDATQDVFIAIRAAAGGYRGDGSSVERWAAGIACKVALNHQRARRRRERRERSGLPEEAASMQREIPDPELVAAARRALEELAERHRLPITLSVFGGLDGEALARELGCSANAARVRLHRALKRLQASVARAGITAAPAVIADGLSVGDAPAPAPELLTRLERLPAPPPPSPLLLSPKGLAMTLSSASLLALACVALSHHVGAVDTPPVPPLAAQNPLAAPVLSLRWQCQAEGTSDVGLQPVVTGDAVLLCGDTRLHCVVAATGATRWSSQGEFEHTRPVVHRDRVLVRNGTFVQALDLASGNLLLALDLDLHGPADIRIDGDHALVASWGGLVRCLDLSHEGRLLWTSERLGAGAAMPAVGEHGDLLVPACDELVALDAGTGARRWGARVGQVGRRSPICSANLVWALTDAATDIGSVVALRATTGEELWRRQVPQDKPPPPRMVWDFIDPADNRRRITTICERGKGISALAGPLLAGDLVVVGSSTDLLAYARDGALRWRIALIAHGPRGLALDRQGRLWAGGDHGELVVADPQSGRELLRRDLDAESGIHERPGEVTIGSRTFPSVGSLSSPVFTGDSAFLLTSGGVALAYGTVPE